MERTVIVMDTREHKGKKDHILSALETMGILVVRSKMYVGDWTLLHDQRVCIDTKKDMQEVYGNLIGDHERFRNECIRARDAGIRLVVLVEETGIRDVKDVAAWVNPRAVQYQQRLDGTLNPYCRAAKRPMPKAPPVSSKRLAGIMQTMAENYGVTWAFCEKEKTGETICQILGVPQKSSSRPSAPSTPASVSASTSTGTGGAPASSTGDRTGT